MQSQGQGTILNIASIAGFQPLPYLSVYAATKAFVLSFSDALWAENQGTGVRILAVCPGPTTSKFAEVAQFPESSANIAAGTPIETPESVVRDALAALKTNQSNIVTGSLFNKLSVNGHRFLPREFLSSLTVKLFRKNLGIVDS
jgi:hypothetical protein